MNSENTGITEWPNTGIMIGGFKYFQTDKDGNPVGWGRGKCLIAGCENAVSADVCGCFCDEHGHKPGEPEKKIPHDLSFLPRLG